MKSILIKLTNDFHNTEINLKADISSGSPWLTKRQLDRAYKALCGIETCTCGGYAAERGKQRWLLDYVYSHEMDIYGAFVIDTLSLRPSEGVVYCMNPHTGTVQSLADWQNDFNSMDEEEWGYETFEEAHLIEVIPDGSGGWIEPGEAPF